MCYSCERSANEETLINIMCGTRMYIYIVCALIFLTTGTVMTLECESPIDSDTCARIRVRCLEVVEENCIASGGRYLERGGFCGYCDLCAIYVGEGTRCNTTEVDTVYGGGDVAVTTVCRPPLVCSRRSNGVCVWPYQCEPSESTDCDYHTLKRLYAIASGV